MKRTFTVIAIILACLSLFIYLYPILSEKRKTNERCQKARDAKAAKAAAAKEEQTPETPPAEEELKQCVVTES